MKYLSLIILAVTLSACSFFQGLVNPSPNIVAALEASLAAADSAAMAYVTLPSCKSQAAPKICRDPTVTANIGKAAQAAFTAVKAAEANETASTVASAQNLVSAYQSIVSSVQ